MDRISNFVTSTKSDLEAVYQVDKQQEYRKIGSIKVQPGHTVYALDLTTGELEPLKYDEKEAALNVVTGEKIASKQAMHKPNYVYVSSLNIKNAKKKAEKIYQDINVKIELIKKNPHLILSNLPFWKDLEDIGFKEYSDSIRTVAGMIVTVQLDTGKKEDMLLLSIRPSIHKELGEVFILSDGSETGITRAKDLSLIIVLEHLYTSLKGLIKMMNDFNNKHTKDSKLPRVMDESIDVLVQLRIALKKVIKANKP